MGNTYAASVIRPVVTLWQRDRLCLAHGDAGSRWLAQVIERPAGAGQTVITHGRPEALCRLSLLSLAHQLTRRI
ncbi:MAG TPA: hypothetical protein VF807_06215 [Ktedonobacterales bacterium]